MLGPSNPRVLLCPEGKPAISFSPPLCFVLFLLLKCALTVALSLTRAAIQLCSCLLKTRPVLPPKAAGAQQTPHRPRHHPVCLCPLPAVSTPPASLWPVHWELLDLGVEGATAWGAERTGERRRMRPSCSVSTALGSDD